MRKSDKKIDNQIRLFLTDLCEKTLKDYEGFSWISHDINYRDFPMSMKITCAFDNSHSLLLFQQSKQYQVEQIILNGLVAMGIKVKSIKDLFSYISVCWPFAVKFYSR